MVETLQLYSSRSVHLSTPVLCCFPMQAALLLPSSPQAHPQLDESTSWKGQLPWGFQLLGWKGNKEYVIIKDNQQHHWLSILRIYVYSKNLGGGQCWFGNDSPVFVVLHLKLWRLGGHAALFLTHPLEVPHHLSITQSLAEGHLASQSGFNENVPGMALWQVKISNFLLFNTTIIRTSAYIIHLKEWHG